MSFALDIHLSPPSDPNIESDLGLFRSVLDCCPSLGLSYDLGAVPARFRRMFIESWAGTIIDEKLNGDKIEDFFDVVKSYQSDNTRTLIESVYQYWEYDDANDILVRVERPLDINLYGRNYVMGGYYYKRYGPIRIAFYNIESFRPSRSLIAAVRDAQARGKDATKWQDMIIQSSQNYFVVKACVKEIITRNVIDHLVICTESEAHPLTAHGIYHRRPQDFIRDLYKIARLHEYGGTYFCDINANDPAFIPARKSSLDYGYLRGSFGNRSNRSFAEKVQRMADRIIQDAVEIQTTPDQVEESFALMTDTDVENINGGYMLSVKEAPFAYLEEPYFILCDRLLSH